MAQQTRATELMDSHTKFDELMEAVRQGSDAAARELFDTYGRHIQIVVRRKLHPRMRTVFDSADFQQAVWASFFALAPHRPDFRTPADLAAFLRQMAANKVGATFRRQMASPQRRLARERPLDAVGDENPALRARPEATPSQHAMADEVWERMLEGSTPLIRRILSLLRAGHTYEDVALQTGLHRKAIQRHVRQLKERMHQ